MIGERHKDVCCRLSVDDESWFANLVRREGRLGLRLGVIAALFWHNELRRQRGAVLGAYCIHRLRAVANQTKLWCQLVFGTG